MSVILHISDPHFGTEQAPVVQALFALAQQQRPHWVVLSGDITQQAGTTLRTEGAFSATTYGANVTLANAGNNFGAVTINTGAPVSGNITVVEQSVANSGEVLQAAQVLAEQNVEAFVKIGDYATIQGFGSIAKVGLEKKIPVYSVDADDIKLPGCLATIGWAYFDDGYAAGKLAVKVLKGESPAKMAFEPLTKTELLVNKATAAAIGVTLPEQLLKDAKEVVG